MASGRTFSASEQEWLRVRSYLRTHRYDLAVDAATAYPADARVARTVFDDLFGTPPQHNAEGQLLPPQQFEPGVITRFATREPMQAAGAATLHLAWHHRDHLLA
jgi:hypothetical protein